MSSLFTHLLNGKRAWNEDGINLIQKRLEKEDSRAKYIDLKSLLEENLCAVGFEKNYTIATSNSRSNCKWHLKTDNWNASVGLAFTAHQDEITFTINGTRRPLRDLLPLWGILRDDYLKGLGNEN